MGISFEVRPHVISEFPEYFESKKISNVLDFIVDLV